MKTVIHLQRVDVAKQIIVAIEIIRTAALVQPYAKNGNQSTQRPVYDWIVRVNGKYVGHSRSLKTAKQIAGDYGTATIVRQD